MPRARPIWLRVLLVAVSVFAVAGCGGGSRPQTTPSPSRSVSRSTSLISMFEAQPELLANAGGTLDELHALGVSAVRLFVPWSTLAPGAGARARPAGFAAANPAAYPAMSWAPYDGVVRAAKARGIAVDLTLEAPAPLWATAPGHPSGAAYAGSWRPRASDYGQFVRAVAVRYSGSYTPPGGSGPLPRVSAWSIWNEPNYGPQLAPQAIDHSTIESSPVIYRGLVDAAWSALQATGHSRDTVLLGELAPRGITAPGYPGLFSGMVPLRFLRALYCVDGSLKPLRGEQATARGCPASGDPGQFASAHPALFHATAFALHLYPFGASAPNVSTPGELGADYADLATVGRFENTVDSILSAYGSTKRFDIYDTEFGYKTNPPYSAGVPLALAAAYMNWSEYLHWRDPRIRSYDQYLLADPTSSSQFATGLEFGGGAHKPSYDAYRIALYLPNTSAKAGASLEVWGCVRPAGVLPGSAAQTAVLQFADPGSTHFQELRRIALTAPGGYLDLPVRFPSSGTVRLAWSYPHGPTVYSRSVAVTIG